MATSKSKALQFLRELHFIEAESRSLSAVLGCLLQFLRELHFIEALFRRPQPTRWSGCSSFGSCTSLRPTPAAASGSPHQVAVPSGAALH